MLSTHRIHRFVAGCGLALALLTTTGGAAAAQPIDPYPRAAAVATPRQDFRSPDARDAAAAVLPRQDLRSGDARDANGFYRPVPAKTAAPAAPTTVAAIDWPMIFLATGGYPLLAVVVVRPLRVRGAARGGRRRRVAA